MGFAGHSLPGNPDDEGKTVQEPDAAPTVKDKDKDVDSSGVVDDPQDTGGD